MPLSAAHIHAQRQCYAAPGSFHDRLVPMLACGLPALVGVLLAVMVVLPLFPTREVSFLLNRKGVAIADDRLGLDSATYRGEDDRGRMFSVAAGSAVQHSAAVPLVMINDLKARMALSDGTAEAEAPSGVYHIDTDRMVAEGPVRMTTTTGYALTTSAVAIDLKHRRAFGEGGVSGTLRTGAFRADRIAVNLETRILTLDGHARLRMTPSHAEGASRK